MARHGEMLPGVDLSGASVRRGQTTYIHATWKNSR